MKAFSKVMALVLSVVMLMSSVPAAVFALGVDASLKPGVTTGTDGYYNVISRKDWVLVPDAATETELVLNNAEGTRRQVLHVIEVDPSNPDVSIVPGYNQIDKDVTQEQNWSHALLTDMAAYYENNLGYNIVGGMNTDLYYDTYAPRILVYNGKDMGVKYTYSPSNSILYVLKDEDGTISCEVKAYAKAEFQELLASGRMLHAVSVSFAMVVKDGQLVNKTVKRGNDDAARSMVGIKEDGTLVICMNDGRGANNSVGLSSYEEGEVMLSLGCKWAANCDGGGSSTFLTKRVGEETFTMRSVPCDGAQRATAHGIFVASNVGPTGELDVINVETDYDIFAPNTTYTFGAQAIDTHGYSMDMPADVSWALSDSSFGTIANGTFVSNGTLGNVDVQVISGGAIVGKKTITVAHPTTFKLSATSTVMPYSTVEKIREITMPIVAQIGEANVYYDTNAVSVALSDENAGTLDGFKFTATMDMSVLGVNVTMTYLPTNAKLVYAIEFGKGSEVIYDFESGDKSGFMGFEEAKQWSIDNGVNNTLVGSDPLAGQFNEYLSSNTYTVTAAQGGEVRNGNYALAWKLDNTDASFASWSYNVLFNTGDTIVLRDVANGMKATTLGMWVYIPVGAPGLAFQSQFYAKNADGSYSCKQDHFMFETVSGARKNLNSCSEADIPESRWVYASIDISKYDYLCTPVATDVGNSRSPSFIRTYVKPTTPAELTFYIDDITLDYSSAVDDRVLPVISAPTYSTSDTAVALNEGASFAGEKVAFSATITDNVGVVADTAKIFVDGVQVNAIVSGNYLSSDDVALLPGAHRVMFEIKDEMGNRAQLYRNFTVEGEAAVVLGGHNDSGEAAKAQSIYYVDINVADVANVNKLVATLKLQNANVWETEGAVVANGFKASFDYNEVSELLTVTVEATGAKAKAADQTLVSIPVRVWTFDRYSYVNNTYYAVADMGNKPVVNVDCKVVCGTVAFADNTTATFGGAINEATELTTISSPYHEHDAELTVLSKDAACTENGYEGRTYCETCKSVVDWGTPVVGTGHNYELVDGQFVCADCGTAMVLGTELFTVNGKYYYAIAGKLVSGWQYIEDEWHYFDETTFTTVASKTFSFSKPVTYDFTADGRVVKGVWVELTGGTRYYYGPDYHKVVSYVSNMQLIEVEGKTYGFNNMGYRYEGMCFCKESTAPQALYVFGEDGVYEGRYNGLYEGKYYVDGLVSGGHAMIKVGDDYYYIKADGRVYVGKLTVAASKTNGLIPAGSYTFGEDGKMDKTPILPKDGVVNGFYYENDVLVKNAGVVEVDGEYYYVRSDGSVYVGKIYVNTAKANGFFKEGYYTFAADGKMDKTPILPKNGIVDGFYYVNGAIVKNVGVVEVDGEYYYVRSDGSVYVGKIYVNTAKANGFFKEGYYTFAADGKMDKTPILPKNGIVNGFYYVNDVIVKNAGVVSFNGEYYYVRSDGSVYVGTIYVSDAKANGFFKQGYYVFGANGAMESEPILPKNGVYNGFYYENDQIVSNVGVVKVDGAYYYVRMDGSVYVGKIFVAETKANGLVKAGLHTFDADGKMIG